MVRRARLRTNSQVSICIFVLCNYGCVSSVSDSGAISRVPTYSRQVYVGSPEHALSYPRAQTSSLNHSQTLSNAQNPKSIRWDAGPGQRVEERPHAPAADVERRKTHKRNDRSLSLHRTRPRVFPEASCGERTRARLPRVKIHDFSKYTITRVRTRAIFPRARPFLTRRSTACRRRRPSQSGARWARPARSPTWARSPAVRDLAREGLSQKAFARLSSTNALCHGAAQCRLEERLLERLDLHPALACVRVEEPPPVRVPVRVSTRRHTH